MRRGSRLPRRAAIDGKWDEQTQRSSRSPPRAVGHGGRVRRPRSATGQGVPHRIPERADTRLGRALARVVPGGVATTWLDRRAQPAHRIPMGRGSVERLPEFAADLVARKVDLIVAPAGSAALAAKNATSTIPIVMIFPRDPVEVRARSQPQAPGRQRHGHDVLPGSRDLRKAASDFAGGRPPALRVWPFCGTPPNPAWRPK